MKADALRLVKAQALGNDFLLVDAADVEPAADLPDLARRACDRHRGFGADGLMILDETAAGADTRLFNADGTPAEVSGNGVRCAAAWIATRRAMSPGDTVVLGTAAGPKRLELEKVTGPRLTFRADMGPPVGPSTTRLDVGGEAVQVVVLRVGNPQCVVLEPPTEARLHGVAAALAVHPFFPEGTNVELAGVEADGRQVRILIWERGVGPTEASGTGACAAAVAAAFAGGAAREVDVISPGGIQHVEWAAETIWLTGWAELVGQVEWWTA